MNRLLVDGSHNSENMTQSHTELIILGQVDRLIRSLSKRTRVRALEFEDLVQEGRLKVIEVIRKYPNKPMKELIPICIQSLKNLYNVQIRTSWRQRNQGIIVDLEDAFAVADKDVLVDIYFKLQLDQLYELLNGDEQRVLDCLLDPPEELIELAREEVAHCLRPEVRITKSILADYLELKRSQLREILNRIHQKVDVAFERAAIA